MPLYNLCVHYVCIYLLIHHRQHTFYGFRAGNVNSVSTLLNIFTVSYGDKKITTCILTLEFTWRTLRICREDFSLRSMATVVDEQW